MPDFAVTYAHEIAALWLGACALFAFAWGAYGIARDADAIAKGDAAAHPDAVADALDVSTTEYERSAR